MDRLSFFKQGLSSVLDATSSLIGIKKAADSFTEAVNEALSEVRTNIGLHLPTLDNDMYTSPESTLDRIAQLGFTSIEVSAFYRGKVHLLPPSEFKALAKKAGLRIDVAYLTMAPTMTPEERANYLAPTKAASESSSETVSDGANKADSDSSDVVISDGVNKANSEIITEEECKETKDPDTLWWENAIATYSQLGCKYISLAYQPEGDSDKAIADFLAYVNLIYTIAAKQNMQLCFHPKTESLIPRNGESALDKIAAQCDAKVLSFEIDTYEAAKAGMAATELIKHFGSRVALLHLHDEYNVGDGDKIDFDATLKEASRHGIDNLYIEVHNFTQPPINCVEKSIFYVEALPSAQY